MVGPRHLPNPCFSSFVGGLSFRPRPAPSAAAQPQQSRQQSNSRAWAAGQQHVAEVNGTIFDFIYANLFLYVFLATLTGKRPALFGGTRPVPRGRCAKGHYLQHPPFLESAHNVENDHILENGVGNTCGCCRVAIQKRHPGDVLPDMQADGLQPVPPAGSENIDFPEAHQNKRLGRSSVLVGGQRPCCGDSCWQDRLIYVRSTIQFYRRDPSLFETTRVDILSVLWCCLDLISVLWVWCLGAQLRLVKCLGEQKVCGFYTLLVAGVFIGAGFCFHVPSAFAQLWRQVS